MGPIERDAGVAAQPGPVVGTDDPNKAANNHLEEKSATPMEAMDKMLAMLGNLSERMNRMEVSQKEQVGKGQKGSPESIFVRPWKWERG